MEMKNFEFTSASTEETAKKLRKFHQLDAILNQKLVLSKFTSQISSIFFIYQAFEPNNPYLNYQDNLKFKRKTKVLELYINLNYAELLPADDEKTLQLLAEAYLKGIEKYLLPRKDFNGNQFYTDVKQLFTEHRLIMD